MRSIRSVRSNTQGRSAIGDADDVGDHVHRELVADVAHELDLAALEGGVDDLRRCASR